MPYSVGELCAVSDESYGIPGLWKYGKEHFTSGSELTRRKVQHINTEDKRMTRLSLLAFFVYLCLLAGAWT